MKITITITTDNATFQDHAGLEVARILHKAGDMLTDWPGANEFTSGLRDANGNKVGQITAEDI